MGVWCGVVVGLGFAIDAALPPLTLAVYGRFSVLYGLLVACTAMAAARTDQAGGRRAILERAGAVVPLIAIAGLTALGTMILGDDLPASMNFHNGFAMRGLLGLLGGMQLIAIFNRGAWRRSTTGLLMVMTHGGILLILSGAALDAAFGQRGILQLHDGGESALFSETAGLANTLTGRTGILNATIRLEGIHTQYYPRKVLLRLYRDGEMTASHVVHKELKGHFDDIAFEVVDYLPHASLNRIVTPSKTPTGMAAAMVAITAQERRIADWLFTEKGNFGFIKRPSGAIIVRFIRGDPAPDRTEAQEIQIDAAASRWRLTGPKRAETWKPLPHVLEHAIDGIKIHVSSFIKDARVETQVENLSQTPEIPVITLRLDRDGDRREMTLSPLIQAPVKLNAHLVLVPALTEEEPSAFTSKIRIRDKQGREQEREIRVNHPLQIGSCRLYQSDFDREDPSFSGFSVNCAPGAWVAKTGMALMIFGLFSAAFVLLRQKYRQGLP